MRDPLLIALACAGAACSATSDVAPAVAPPPNAGEVAAPPWHLRCIFDRELGGLSVVVWHGDDPAGLSGWLTHRWAAGALEVTDATGGSSWTGAGHGSGSTSVATFLRPEGPPPTPPFAVRLRVPAAWTFEAVVFPLEDLKPIPFSAR